MLVTSISPFPMVCWLPAFSPFPMVFSRALFFGVVKRRECMVKSKMHFVECFEHWTQVSLYVCQLYSIGNAVPMCLMYMILQGLNHEPFRKQTMLELPSSHWGVLNVHKVKCKLHCRDICKLCANSVYLSESKTYNFHIFFAGHLVV